MPAFFRRTLLDFLSDHEDRIVGRLTSGASDAGFFQQVHAQTAAWQVEVGVLKACARLVSEFDATTWQILPQYPIPRRGKRIDAVLIADTLLIVLEFRCGARVRPGRHGGGRGLLPRPRRFSRRRASTGRSYRWWSPRNRPMPAPEEVGAEWVRPTWRANARDLPAKISECIARNTENGAATRRPESLGRGRLHSNANHIEAAQALYAGKNVAKIALSCGDR